MPVTHPRPVEGDTHWTPEFNAWATDIETDLNIRLADAALDAKYGGGGSGGGADLPPGEDGQVLTAQGGAWVAADPIASGVELIPPEQLADAGSLVVWVENVAYRTTLLDLADYFGATGGGGGGGGSSGAVQFAPATLNLTQGAATGAIQYALSQAPTADVTLTLVSDEALVAVSPSSLVFTPANFATPQQVVVTPSVDYLTGKYEAHVNWSSTSTDFAFVGLSGSSKVVVTGVALAKPLYLPHPDASMADDFSQGGTNPIGRTPSLVSNFGPWSVPPTGYDISGGALRNIDMIGGWPAYASVGPITKVGVFHMVFEVDALALVNTKPSFWPFGTYPKGGNTGLWEERGPGMNAIVRTPYTIRNNAPDVEIGVAGISGTYPAPIAGSLYDLYIEVDPIGKALHYFAANRPGLPSGPLTIGLAGEAAVGWTGANAMGWGGYNSGTNHILKMCQYVPGLSIKTLLGL